MHLYAAEKNYHFSLCVCYSLSIQETEGSHVAADATQTGSMWTTVCDIQAAATDTWQETKN